MLSKPIEFWAAVLVVIAVKIQTSKSLGWKGVLATVIVAIASAYAFTDAALEYFPTLNPTIAAALVALTAEGVMRFILQVSHNPDELRKLFSYFLQHKTPPRIDDK